jgi:hypothetical protein
MTFLSLTSIESSLPGSSEDRVSSWYPWFYSAKIAATSLVAWWCRATWTDYQPWPGARAIVASVLVGVGVIVAWVGLDGLYPTFGLQGKRTGFNPWSLPPAGRFAFLTVRLFGLVALVPLIEELFWRSFLLRYVINPDFRAVPIGRVTPLAAVVTAIGFALAHPEWLPALLTGLAWAVWLGQTRSLATCLISHVTANMALGAYVLATGSWRFL